jgi:hypothetical protein
MPMMTQDQAKVVAHVFRQFLTADIKHAQWTHIDDQMEALDWLSDDQVCVEAEVIYNKQKDGNPRCIMDHEPSKCMVPLIIEAVQVILKLNKETGFLHYKNRFILQYYLLLSHIGEIIS